jgi:hypothetical protein
MIETRDLKWGARVRVRTGVKDVTGKELTFPGVVMKPRAAGRRPKGMQGAIPVKPLGVGDHIRVVWSWPESIDRDGAA